MWTLIQAFLGEMLNSALREALVAMQSLMQDVFYAAFYIERLSVTSNVLTTVTVKSAVEGTYFMMVTLLALKLIWKGWNVYVLWRGGESENSPLEIAKGAGFAVVVAVAFPTVYQLAVNILRWIGDVVLQAFGAGSGFDTGGSALTTVINMLSGATAQSASILLTLVVYVIVLLIAICQMLFRGVELLVFRLGVPLAVVGLVDSDDGVWKAYAQALIRQFATVLVQYFLIILGIWIIGDMTLVNLGLGIVFEIAAFKAPKMLSQLLLPAGGGGGGKLYALALVARSFAGA